MSYVQPAKAQTSLHIRAIWSEHLLVAWISILLKEPFALKNSETVYLTIIFSTLSYSDFALIDNFDLIFFYFYFVFEIFGNNSVSIP